jgi:hypothetical protein
VRREAGAGQELRRRRAAVRGGDVREGGVDGQVVLDDLDAQLGIDEREQLEPGGGQERVRVGPERPLAGERARQATASGPVSTPTI